MTATRQSKYGSILISRTWARIMIMINTYHDLYLQTDGLLLTDVLGNV